MSTLYTSPNTFTVCDLLVFTKKRFIDHLCVYVTRKFSKVFSLDILIEFILMKKKACIALFKNLRANLAFRCTLSFSYFGGSYGEKKIRKSFFDHIEIR